MLVEIIERLDDSSREQLERVRITVSPGGYQVAIKCWGRYCCSHLLPSKNSVEAEIQRLRESGLIPSFKVLRCVARASGNMMWFLDVNP